MLKRELALAPHFAVGLINTYSGSTKEQDKSGVTLPSHSELVCITPGVLARYLRTIQGASAVKTTDRVNANVTGVTSRSTR